MRHSKTSCPLKACFVIFVCIEFIVFVAKNNNLVIVSLKRKQALLASNLSEIRLTDWNGH